MDQATITCGRCGATNEPGAVLCVSCGALLAAYAPPPGSLSPTPLLATAPASVPPSPLTLAPAEIGTALPPTETVRERPTPAVVPLPTPPASPEPEPRPVSLPPLADAPAELQRARAELLAVLRTRPAELLSTLHRPAAIEPQSTFRLQPAPITIDVLSPRSGEDRSRLGGPLWQAIVAEREVHDAAGRWQTTKPWQVQVSGRVWSGSFGRRQVRSGTKVASGWALLAAVAGCAVATVLVGGRSPALAFCFGLFVFSVAVYALARTRFRPPGK